MADQSDIETTLVDLTAAILYPHGPNAPSILNRLCRVYRGWPHSGSLDDDLAAGHVNVTVFSEPRHQSVTTRYPDEFQVVVPARPTYSIVTTASTATVAGPPAAGQLVGLLVDELAVVHRTGATDRPELVAAILTAQLATRRAALVAGATITIPGATRVIGRVVADQPVQAETRRQLQGFRLTLWCPDPAARDAAGSAIDAALSTQRFIDLPDGSAGRLAFHGSTVLDHGENAALYRRDLHYTVEYATTRAAILPAMIFGDVALGGSVGAASRHCLG